MVLRIEPKGVHHAREKLYPWLTPPAIVTWSSQRSRQVKGACHQTQWPDFELWDPRGGTQNPTLLLLSFDLHMQLWATHASHHTLPPQTRMYQQIENMVKLKQNNISLYLPPSNFLLLSIFSNNLWYVLICSYFQCFLHVKWHNHTCHSTDLILV